MLTPYGHLTYCSNIHPGITWDDHFRELKINLPYIRQRIAGNQPLALGLRCAHEASLNLEKPEVLDEFKKWLDANKLYVFCLNGFPYGSFHQSVVKDQVHAPDWTTSERTEYTKRLFRILSQLLPEGIDGGVSTPPLSYRHWWKGDLELGGATEKATINILEVVDFLIDLEQKTGKSMHLDIEPEPDGILDSGSDFFEWYLERLIPAGVTFLKDRKNYSSEQARAAIFRYVQLCYDVCHFAVSYESPQEVFARLEETGIRVGRLQLSSALRVDLNERKEEKLAVLATFNEPVYLHQVVAKTTRDELLHYADLDQAFADDTNNHVEWRVHFHVPLFVDAYGLLDATQSDIKDVLSRHKGQPVTSCLEVETYTWSVLPGALQIPVSDSIIRELSWVKEQLEINTNE